MAKRILLVENEKNLARFVSLELQKESFLVDLAETGQEGLALAKDVDYDLLLLNYDLQDMTASDFAKQLSLIKPASVIIVLASREEIADQQEAIQHFAVSYVCLLYTSTNTVPIPCVGSCQMALPLAKMSASAMKRWMLLGTSSTKFGTFPAISL